MLLRPFTRHNFKNSVVYSSCECLLSKATCNSNSQNETTENTSTLDEVRK